MGQGDVHVKMFNTSEIKGSRTPERSVSWRYGFENNQHIAGDWTYVIFTSQIRRMRKDWGKNAKEAQCLRERLRTQGNSRQHVPMGVPGRECFRM